MEVDFNLGIGKISFVSGQWDSFDFICQIGEVGVQKGYHFMLNMFK